MFAEYTRDMSQSYMLVREEGEAPADSYELKILMSNRIPGIMPMEIEEADGQIRYRFDITSCQPFASFCSGSRMTAQMLRSVYLKLFDTLLCFEDYLLDADHLLLDQEFLYFRMEEEMLQIAYVPSYSKSIRQSLISFTEAVIMQISHGRQETIVLACRILHELQQKDVQLLQLRQNLLTENPSLMSETDGEAAYWKGEAGREENVRAKEFVPLYAEGSAENLPEGALPDSPVPGDAGNHKQKGGNGISAAIRTQVPERDTVRMALLAAVPAALIYVILQVQTVYLLSTTEVIGLSLLAAAGILLAFCIRERRRKVRPVDGSAEPYSPEDDVEMPGVPQPDDLTPFYMRKSDSYMRNSDSYMRKSDSYTRNSDDRPGQVMDENPAGNPQYPEMFEDDCMTTILSAAPRPKTEGAAAKLLPAGEAAGNDPIALRGREILIGKQPSLADAVIAADTISRIHARVFEKDGRHYISDMGSKNGTFVDGRPVVGREEVPLEEGTRVTFADLEYIYTRE